MDPPWTPDFQVSPDTARGLIDRQFPELRPVGIRLLGNGWDNTAYLINEAYVFRFPRRETARDLLDNECRVLPLLSPHLALAVPQPLFIGEPDASYPCAFAGYRYIPGRTGCALDWSDAMLANAADDLGRFLGSLHTLPGDEQTRLTAPQDTIRRADVSYRAARAIDDLESLGSLISESVRTRAIDLAKALACAPQSAERPCWVHGDLYARHVLAQADGRVLGVIDWGDVHLGDPALDLSIALTLCPSHLERFKTAYGLEERDAALWDRARLRALSYGIILTGYGAASADSRIQSVGRSALLGALDGQ